MNVVPVRVPEPARRLLAAAGARPPVPRPEAPGPVVYPVTDATPFDELVKRAEAHTDRPTHLLVLSRLGAHPDARHPALRRLWSLEEGARASGLPTLTLRFAPLVGPATPLWTRLRARPALPRGGRQLVNPVAESDAVETLRRALAGAAAWEGWYEVAGAEAWTLAELRDLAAAAGPGPDAGAWEPPLEEIAEHRLAECQPWASHFGITPAPVADAVRGVAA